MAAFLEALRYDAAAAAASTSVVADDQTESKFGIPRFSGEPSALNEYAYRVRARVQRESHMDAGEVKKLGPLGLRLVEGLRGTALKMAQQIEPSKLATTEAPEILITLFEKNLRPRREQEARELYAIGSRDGGMMSRQRGEPVSSYVLRRKTWWRQLQQLDPSMAVSEGILAEQILQNAGLSEDQKLMIRTTLRGKMEVELVADELLNQHPRLHERERLPRRHPGSFKGSWRSKGKGFSHKAFHVDEEIYEESPDWETASQSLAGFTEVFEDDDENTTYLGYEDSEGNDLLAEWAAYFIDEGLDMQNEEACALAAEAIQLENEAYFVRGQAKGKGPSGFSGSRQFEVSGSLSLQEKRARLQQLKSKTECRKCGQRGHWSGDPQCPKGTGKGDSKSKKSFSSSTTAASGKHGKKGSKGGGTPKTRVVYFAMHDGPQDYEIVNEDTCLMAVSGGTGSGSEPPSEVPTSRTPSMQSTAPAGGPSSSLSTMFAMMPPPTAASMQATMATQELERGWTADQVLDFMLHNPEDLCVMSPEGIQTAGQAPRQTGPMHPQAGYGQLDTPTRNPPPTAMPLHVPPTLVGQVLNTLMDMEVEEESPPGEPASGSASTNVTSSAPATPQQEACSHIRVTKKGSNGYYLKETCLDCGLLLKNEKKMIVGKNAQPVEGAPGFTNAITTGAGGEDPMESTGETLALTAARSFVVHGQINMSPSHLISVSMRRPAWRHWTACP